MTNTQKTMLIYLLSKLMVVIRLTHRQRDVLCEIIEQLSSSMIDTDAHGDIPF